MILKDTATNEELELSDELLWVDEFGWMAVQVNKEFSLTGALHIQTGKRKAGRPISLEPPDDSMAWMTRATTQTLINWSAIQDRVFQLQFQRGSSRVFHVRFDHDKPIEAKPVLGAVGKNEPDDQFLTKVYFYEVLA